MIVDPSVDTAGSTVGGHFTEQDVRNIDLVFRDMKRRGTAPPMFIVSPCDRADGQLPKRITEGSSKLAGGKATQTAVRHLGSLTLQIHSKFSLSAWSPTWSCSVDKLSLQRLQALCKAAEESITPI